MTKQLQKVQCTYDNATAKSTIHIWQYNCKKYNKSMAIQLQKVQYKYDNICKKYNIRMTIQLQKVQYTYDNTATKNTIHV